MTLLAALLAEALGASSASDGALAWCAVARLSGERLASRDQARLALDRAREAAGSDLDALGAVARAAEDLGEYRAAVSLHRARAELSPGVEAAAALLCRAAELLERELRDEAAAIAAYREALTLAPGEPVALRALRRLHRARREWEGLVEVVRAEAAAARDASLRARLLTEAAALCELILGARERALEAYREAAALEPEPGAAARATARLERGAPSEAEGAARALRELLDRVRQPRDAAAVHLALAALHEGPLADPPRALSHLAAAAAAAPGDAGVLERLARAHRAAGNWPAAGEALRRLLELPGLGPEERCEAYLALADVRSQGYGDEAGARELASRAQALRTTARASELEPAVTVPPPAAAPPAAASR